MSAAAIATVTLKSDRPREVARFWRDFLDYRVAPNHTDSVLLLGDPGPALLIQPSERDPGPGAIHLDIRPDDQTRCVERALALGATYADVGQSGDEGWVVLADPGGNLFCVLQSGEQHHDLGRSDPGTPTPID